MMRAVSLWAALWAALPMPAQPVQFRTAELPWAVIGFPYNAQMETAVDARCLNTGGAVLTVGRGALPGGLAIRGESLVGIPMAIGAYRFALRAATPCGAAEREYELVVTGKPILRAAPEELLFEARAGGAAPQSQTIAVSSTWPGLPYTVRVGNGPWVSCRVARGSTPDRESPFSGDSVTVQVNPDKLSPGTYRATLSISAWQAANSPAISIVLRVTE